MFNKTNKKIDYNLKAKVIKNNIHLLEKDISKSKYAKYINSKYGKNVKYKYSDEKIFEIEQSMIRTQKDEWIEAQRINRAYRARLKRAKCKIKNMLQNGVCLFLTLTFSDKVLNNTSFDTRRQKVRRFLSSFKCEYLAGVDYGKKSDREHYHAIIQASKIDVLHYDYGLVNCKRIKQKNDYIKIAKYLIKTTNIWIANNMKPYKLLYNRSLS